MTQNRAIGRLLAALCLLAALSQAVWAAPEARLDRTKVSEGETVVLIITVPGGSSGDPDLSALAKDFDLVNQSQGMQMSMINGRSSSSRNWQLVLAPRHTGTIAIPPIPVGGEATKALSLEVLPAGQASQAGPAAPVMIEIDLAPKQAYVQQKLVYTARILSRVPLRQVRIAEPRSADAIIEPLGTETEYTTQRDGQQYRVSERRYAVFPQRSGELKIEGPLLAAEVPDPNARGGRAGQPFGGRDPFADFDRLFGRAGVPGFGSLFEQGRPIQLRGAAQTLEVRAQPANGGTPWLPAESVTLNETWSSNPPVFRVGEPVTRNLVITAQGLSATQLPELDPETPQGVKAYPDKSQVQARVDGDTLIAQKVLRTALVPSQAGRVTLPAVRLAWWDTAADAPRVAELPAREVEVLPGAAGSATAAASAADGAGTTAPAVARPGAVDAEAPRAASTLVGDLSAGVGRYWPWVAALFACAWLVTLAMWWRARRRRRIAPQASAVAATEAMRAAPDARAALAAVERACRANQAAAARRAILDWAAARWPAQPPLRLDQIGERLGGDAAVALAALDRHLYAESATPWDGVTAWGLLAPQLSAKVSADTPAGGDKSLPPLYPQGA